MNVDQLGRAEQEESDQRSDVECHSACFDELDELTCVGRVRVVGRRTLHCENEKVRALAEISDVAVLASVGHFGSKNVNNLVVFVALEQRIQRSERPIGSWARWLATCFACHISSALLARATQIDDVDVGETVVVSNLRAHLLESSVEESAALPVAIHCLFQVLELRLGCKSVSQSIQTAKNTDMLTLYQFVPL